MAPLRVAVFRPSSESGRTTGAISWSERERETIRSINQRIFDTSLDLILVVDRRGVFLRVSPSSRAILGYAPEDMIGRNAKDFIFIDDLESAEQRLTGTRRLLTDLARIAERKKAG